MLLDSWKLGDAEQPRPVLVVEWPSLAAARRAGLVTLAALHAERLRVAAGLVAYDAVAKGQKRGKAAGDLPLPMVGVCRRRRGKLAGKQHQPLGDFGLWGYTAFT